MKRGITLISIIIYLVLFTTFTAFVLSMNSNIERNVLMNKGNSIIETEYSKLYTNLFASAKDSTDYSILDGDKQLIIEFSNGDVYNYDKDNGRILKNNGILVTSVSNFKQIDVTSLAGARTITVNNL